MHDLLASRRLRTSTLFLAFIVVAGFLTLLGTRKYFSIDEFQYGHAAWLVAGGSAPYADFFEVHFPLVYQLGSVLLRPDSDPVAVLRLRWMMALLATVGVVSAFAFARRVSGSAIAGTGAAVLLLVNVALLNRLIEIRPDATAFAFFLLALSAAVVAEREPRAAILAGLALGAACWAAQKTFFYGGPLGVAMVLPLLRREGRGRALRFLTGFLAIVALVALYLTVTRLWGPWWQWTIEWASIHQKNYPRFPWTASYRPWAPGWTWVLVWGVAGAIAGLRAPGPRRTWAAVVVSSWILATLGYVLQTGPFDYNLIPVFGLAAILGGIALDASWRARRGLAGKAALLFLAVSLILALPFMARDWTKVASRTNERQLATWRALGRITASSDPVYDNSGAAITRPHVLYFFYTDDLLRARLRAELERVPEQLVQAACPVVLMEPRFGGLPPRTREFILAHYLPWSDDLFVWGTRLPAGALQQRQFWAIMDGDYAVVAPSGVVVNVDGRRAGQRVHLRQGPHEVAYDSAAPLEILWIPRDGQSWKPLEHPRPAFTTIL